MRRNVKGLLAAAATLGLLVAEGTGFAADIKERSLKVAFQNSEGSAQYEGAKRFADLVSQKSGSKIKVKLFPGGALGKDTAVVSAMQGGTIEMCIMNSSLLVGVVKEFGVLDFPFAVTTEKEAYAVVDGPFGKKLHDMLQPKGLIGLAYFELGFRQFHNGKRPIARVEDLQGLKIRVIETPIYIDFINAMGANAVPIPFPELYTALEQKTVDGGTQPLINIVNTKFNEVQKYLSLTSHMYNPQSVLMSKKTWDKLSADEKKIIEDAASEAKDYQRKVSQDKNAEALVTLKKSMQVNEVPAAELAKMKDKAKPLVDKYTKELGEPLVREMYAEIAKARGGK